MSSKQQRILVLQHSRDSPMGVVGEALHAAGAQTSVVDCFKGLEVTAEHAAFDGLLLLGGPQCAGDDVAHPSFPPLLDLIRAYHASARPVLGICLGGQLVARALGGKVHAGNRGEFGFTPLERTTEPDPVLDGIAWPVPIMQWHDDSFDPPPGAARLLASAVCAEQGFRMGAATYGFQCHFEVDRDILADWASLRARLTGNPEVEAQIAAEAARHLASAEAAGRSIAAGWLKLFP